MNITLNSFKMYPIVIRDQQSYLVPSGKCQDNITVK